MADSIRSLALADLDDDGVDRLIAEGETLFVERKAQIPGDGIGPTVASFANTLGGWILLGVDNEGEVVGWDPPGRAEPQDHLRELLRRDVDPLPPFAARTWVREEKQLTVVRVAESFDTPHLVSRTGSIFVREPGGKRPIRDHRELVELARRGERARHEATDRLRLGLIVEAMRSPERIYGDEPLVDPAGYEPLVEVIVYASPLTVGTQFSDAAISRRVAGSGALRLAPLFPLPATDPHPIALDVEPRARGVVFVGTQRGVPAYADLAIDSGGAVAVRWAWRRTGGTLHLDAFGSETLLRLIGVAANTLDDLGGLGRAVVGAELRCEGELLVSAGAGQLATYTPGVLWLGGDLPIPAEEDDRLDLTGRWCREIARAAGLQQWEEA